MPVINRTQRQDQSDNFKRWLEKKAKRDIRRDIFFLELNTGIFTEADIETYNIPDTQLISKTISRLEAEVEYYKQTYPGVSDKLTEALNSDNLDFDIYLLDENNKQGLVDFQNFEIVFFKNRTTAFTLEKPCPNCGKKELIAEAMVFTRSADEAQDQFASCKNCSSRYKLRSVI